MRGAIQEAEDALEFSLSKQIHLSCPSIEGSNSDTCCAGKPGTSHQTWKRYTQLCYHLHQLNKVVQKNIVLVSEKLKEIKNCSIEEGVRVEASSSAVQQAMIGFGNESIEIKSRLYGGASSKLEVIPIAGMGGIGKTTLARNVYDDPLIVECFQIRLWVTVTQDYNVQEIVSNLLLSMDVKKESMEEHHVYQNLKWRKYLVVLDDLWSTKGWDDLNRMFPDDGNGSRIVITTRLSDVAAYPNPYSHVYEMQLMDDGQSWNLLQLKVFRQEHSCPNELEDVGKTIARNCRGLPLAIAVVSGLLAVDQSKPAWEDIARDVKSAISANDEQFSKILSLSYTRLPHHLRPCFLYMGGFREDHVVRASSLVRLWVAEGFLRSNGCNKSIEETAEEYLEELVGRNLVLVCKRKCDGRIKTVSMQDLMRDMCVRRAEEESFILHLPGFLDHQLPRRLTGLHSQLESFLGEYCCSTIRTLIQENPTKEGASTCCLGELRLLRILDLSEAHGRLHSSLPTRPLPSEVFQLLHLRYLAVDSLITNEQHFPNLKSLQTLIIKATCVNVEDFPVEIWRLPQLRHLICNYAHLPPSLSEEGPVLKNLLTLSTAKDFVCSQETLKMIPNVKKLSLCYLGSEDTNTDISCLQNLIHLQQLEDLKLRFEHKPKINTNVVFSRTLRKLSLSGLGLPWEDMTIVGCLPDLQVLKLRDGAFVGPEWETTEGEFPQLIYLLVEKLDLQSWITESSHFPKLKCLVISHCPNLEQLPDGIGDIPTLEQIKLNEAGDSLFESVKLMKDDQRSYGNYVLQISRITEYVEVTLDLTDDDLIKIVEEEHSQVEEEII